MHVFYVSLNKKVLTTNIDCQKNQWCLNDSPWRETHCTVYCYMFLPSIMTTKEVQIEK